MTDDAPAHDALEGFPLSPQQRHAWDRLSDGAEVTLQLRVTGASADDIREAVAQTVGQFEILRTTVERLPGMAAPLQVIHDELPVVWQAEGERDGGPGIQAGLERVGNDDRRCFKLC